MVEEMGKSPLVEVGRTPELAFPALRRTRKEAKNLWWRIAFFDKKTGDLRNRDEQYNRRINTDISLITNKIKSVTGKSPRAWCGLMVRANGTTLKLAKEHMAIRWPLRSMKGWRTLRF